jgi:hypothetical protein
MMMRQLNIDFGKESFYNMDRGYQAEFDFGNTALDNVVRLGNIIDTFTYDGTCGVISTVGATTAFRIYDPIEFPNANKLQRWALKMLGVSK